MITFEEKRYPNRPDYICRSASGVKTYGTIFWDGCPEYGEYWFEPSCGSELNHISQRDLATILDKIRQLNMNKGDWE